MNRFVKYRGSLSARRSLPSQPCLCPGPAGKLQEITMINFDAAVLSTNEAKQALAAYRRNAPPARLH